MELGGLESGVTPVESSGPGLLRKKGKKRTRRRPPRLGNHTSTSCPAMKSARSTHHKLVKWALHNGVRDLNVVAYIENEPLYSAHYRRNPSGPEANTAHRGDVFIQLHDRRCMVDTTIGHTDPTAIKPGTAADQLIKDKTRRAKLNYDIPADNIVRQVIRGS